ncbi:MAG: fibronectin type III domain-containing protein [Gaiellales bacterium]
MDPRRSISRLAILLLALGAVLGLATSASATALTPVVVVDYASYPTWGITPSSLTGAAGDTFQVENDRYNDNGVSYISVVNDSGSVTMGGVACTTNTACKIYDTLSQQKNQGTFTIVSGGTLQVHRSVSGGAPSQILTFTLNGATTAPGAPSGVTATAGDAQATVSWAAPGSDGGAAIISYTVTASPGGATCTATAPATTCTVTGLRNGTAYSFSVTAMNSAGTGAASSASSAVTPATAGASTTTAASCASSGWGFGIVTVGTYGDRMQVTWKTPKVCDESTITGYTLAQAFTKDGPETTVDLAASCQVGSGGPLSLPVSETVLHSVNHACPFPTAGPTERWFRLTARTASGKTVTARRISWVRDRAPDADVADLAAGSCPTTTTRMPRPRPVDSASLAMSSSVQTTINRSLICFVLNLVIQTEYASNGNSALTQKQMVEVLDVGIEIPDAETARAARWVSAGQLRATVRGRGFVAVPVPLNRRATAKLRTGALHVRITVDVTRGAVTRHIVRFATLPKYVAPSGVPSVTG